MFINKTEDGKCNLCGDKLRYYRKQLVPKVSQNALAKELQRAGLDLDKNAVQRIEAGKRFVTDIELKVIAEIMKIDVRELIY